MAQLDLDELSQRYRLCLIAMELQHTGEVTSETVLSLAERAQPRFTMARGHLQRQA
jgi:hypothetical protein